ncbi:molybdopterin-dependent oxidoreductase [Salisediminibacterium selenitireducens]|nr:molybdopterin-dependent oxidoreductase [Salisediminibacterium selenitireducens]
MHTRYTRNTCPRNCYSSCSMISHVSDGVLEKVNGDPKHGFSRGKLCAKGYGYPEFVYSDKRLKYPVKRKGERGAGKWERISWQEAFEMLATELINSFDQRNSFRSVAYNSFSGNIGFLHHAMTGFFSYLGDHTYAQGNPCLGTGKKALEDQRYSIPFYEAEEMAKGDYIIIWGSNPAVTNIHQMKYIHAARDRGAELIVIDPVYTQTAKAADIYIQIRAGSDASLAALILNELVQSDHVVRRSEHHGFQLLINDLKSVSTDKLKEETGISEEALTLLADCYAFRGTVISWIGFGMQRYSNGADSVRMIDALSILTEQDSSKRPVYYLNPMFFDLHDQVNQKLLPPKSNGSRSVSYNHFAKTCLDFSSDPVDFLWILNRNPLSQDESLNEWKQLIKNVPFLVVSDLRMTKTAAYADLVLPVTSHFEQYDLHVSYWNSWLSLNEPAIKPLFESKSDVMIASGVSKAMNRIRPGISSYPEEQSELDWIRKIIRLFAREQSDLLTIDSLRFGPMKLQAYPHTAFISFVHPDYEDKSFLFDSFLTDKPKPMYEFRLLSAQSLMHIHSQFETKIQVPGELTTDQVGISEGTAKTYHLRDGDRVIIFNDTGEVKREVRIIKAVPNDVLLMRQGGADPVNRLIKNKNEKNSDDHQSTSFFDNRASLILVGR